MLQVGPGASPVDFWDVAARHVDPGVFKFGVIDSVDLNLVWVRRDDTNFISRFSQLIAEGWSQAYSRFLEGYKDQDWSKLDPQAATEDWIKQANKALLEIQSSEPFLEAQRSLLNASLKLKKQQVQQVDAWAKQMGLPTRAEVDELIDIVHDLRKQVAELKG